MNSAIKKTCGDNAPYIAGGVKAASFTLRPLYNRENMIRNPSVGGSVGTIASASDRMFKAPAAFAYSRVAKTSYQKVLENFPGLPTGAQTTYGKKGYFQHLYSTELSSAGLFGNSIPHILFTNQCRIIHEASGDAGVAVEIARVREVYESMNRFSACDSSPRPPLSA